MSHTLPMATTPGFLSDGPDDERDGELTDTAHRLKRGYAGAEERPLGSYAALMGAYAATVITLSGVVRWRGEGLPDRLGAADLALLSVATHKASRLLAMDPVTSPLRAPFTRFKGTSGPAELQEDAEGVGPRKAMGELVTCPFCLGQWVATGLAFGFVLAPRSTRLAASILTGLTAADFLQFAYVAAENAAES